jgi:invasion protein IalB
LSTVVITAAVALAGVIYFADRNAGALAQTQSRAAATGADRLPPKQLAQAHPAPAGGNEQPVRTETITYGEWTVTCRYAPKKVCSAELSIVTQQQNQAVNLGTWIIAHNNQGTLISLLQTPQINVGVLVSKGIELKLGNAKPIRISYTACNPQRCEGTVPMDEALIKEAVASSNGSAAITFWKADGFEFTINIQSIKGIDKAIAAVR